MRTHIPNREVGFHVMDGCLVRTVAGGDGRCELKAFETVAHAIEETPAQGEGTTLMLIARKEKLAFTQVNVALEFLKEPAAFTSMRWWSSTRWPKGRTSND